MTPVPGSITVVGLGPGDPALLTLGARAALDRAARIVLRTSIHPGLNLDLASDPRVVACDDFYEDGSTFDEVYAAIAERVLAVTREVHGEVVYAVPGHPKFGERTVDLLLPAAAAAGIPVVVLPAVSYLDAVAIAVGADPMAAGLQLLDALDLRAALDAEPFAGGLLAVDPTRPLLIAQVYDREAATAAKLWLARTYPDDHPVTVLSAAGVAGEQSVTQAKLYELDRLAVDHLTSVWVQPLDELDAARSAVTLQRIVARLRGPGGCPWDHKQSHASLRQAVIEEAFETVDAIDAGDPDNLAEELGDLLIQVALHAQIAEEAGEFVLEDVYEAVNRKLVRRHPHVFGKVVAETAGEVVRTWESVKAAERARSGKPAKTAGHPLDALPRSMPALERARALLGPRKGDAPPNAEPDALAAAGGTILAAVEAALAEGIDPDQALERVLRLRFATAATST
jgi:tetrapyrrole methylase family protein/MazG family protein